MTSASRAFVWAAALAASLAVSGVARAQTLADIKVEPAQARAGEKVTLTANFDVANAINCAVQIQWGDGVTDTFKVNNTKDVPMVISHAYPKAGAFKVKVEPKRVGPVLQCSGKGKEAAVTIVAPPPAATAAAPGAAKAASPCPEGWKLDKAGVNKKTGAFTCTARAGTALPQARLACPGSLGYFENAKKGQLGCKP